MAKIEAAAQEIYVPPKVTWKKDLKKNGTAYLFFAPMFIYQVLFAYLPMFGILMAFENFKVNKGYFKSEWVGLQHFVTLFTSEEFPRALRNTVVMGLLNLTIGFIMPVIFAFLLSMIKKKKTKRLIQTCSYIPNFVSAVVVCSLIREFLGRDGALTGLLSALGFEQQNWLANGDIPVFWLINTFMNIWCAIGWGSIMYVASIATVSGDLHEAAAIDGATRFQRLTKITLPCILPIIVMMFTLQVGLVFVTGFDKVLLLYMPSTYSTADCLQTYTYRLAFSSGANYGLSSAAGLFQSVMGTALLMISNYWNRKVSGMSLF
jgi:ABC-type polysaccharide transport system permease subunit